MTTATATALHPAEQYVEDVLAGRIVACKWLKLAVARHVHDLQHAGERGFHFDARLSKRSIKFFELLQHSKGEWAGKALSLEPWQQFILWCIFGWVREDGTRRFTKAMVEVARKNGKSTFAAGVGLYLLTADGEQGAEIYAAATKKDQARIVFDEAAKMVRASPALRKHLSVFRSNITMQSTASKFEPLSSDEDSMDGLNVHAAIIDELHAHKTRAVYDVLDSATGSRRQPLLLTITTAGAGTEGIWNEEHGYAEKVLEGFAKEGGIKDDKFFACVYLIDAEDDWRDEACWIKANPNLGVSVKPDDLRGKCRKAMEMPSAQNEFLRKHMNRKTQQVTRWLDLDQWDGCGEAFDESKLVGRECYAGLDLSSKTDLSAWVKVFPPAVDDGKWRVMADFFSPAETAELRERRDRAPYKQWADQGCMILTEGNAVDYDVIIAKILADRSRYEIQEIAYDPWGATHLATRLMGEGAVMVEFGQGYRSMSEPTKELEKLVVTKMLAHGGNPALRWMASHVCIETDPAGNVKPSKRKSTERIDGIVALVMALGRAIVKAGGESVYESRGIEAI
jgi:phage terminase large subunit-like protein